MSVEQNTVFKCDFCLGTTGSKTYPTKLPEGWIEMPVQLQNGSVATAIRHLCEYCGAKIKEAMMPQIFANYDECVRPPTDEEVRAAMYRSSRKEKDQIR